MSRLARLRRGAGLPIALASLSAFVVVSCVTVASTGEVLDIGSPPDAPLAGAVTSAPGTATPAVTVRPTPTATVRPGPTATARPAPTPSASLVPSATAVTTLPPSPGVQGTPATTPALAVGSHAPTVVPSPSVEPVVVEEPRVRTTGPRRLRLDRATRRKLDAILTNQVRNKGFVGLQAAVRLPSGETWVGTAGNAEFGPARAVRDETQFAIASVTKTFVAALILQLADEGRIDLDAPYGTYFDGAPRPKTVSVRQLLSHTSGIYDFFSHPRYTEAAGAWLRAAPQGINSREHRWTFDEIMGMVKSGYCKPGKCYRYSNTNYVILGKVAEAVGGEPLDTQLRTRFFEPLGLDDTVYQPAQRPRPDAAHGHWGPPGAQIDHTRGARLRPFMAAASVADAAGAIASTAADLATWSQALYGGDLLSDASLRQMTRILPEGTYGLGTDVAIFAGHRGYGHRGGLRGFESSMWYFPDTGVSVALLSNRGNFGTDNVVQRLVQRAIGRG